MLVWLSVWSEVQTCIWPSGFHCHSLSLASVKSRLVFTFLLPAHPGSPRKRAVKWVCVCAVHETHRIFKSFHLKGVKTSFSILSECPAFTAVHCYRLSLLKENFICIIILCSQNCFDARIFNCRICFIGISRIMNSANLFVFKILLR